MCLADACAIAAFSLIAGLLVSVLSLPAPAHPVGHRAVIFPPWTPGSNALDMAARSGARLVGAGRYPFIVIVAGVDGATSQGITGSLFSFGADGLGGCIAAVETRR